MDADKQAEAKELLEKLAGLFASDAITDGQMKTFDDLEIEANEFGDQVSALLVQRSIEQDLEAQGEAAKCPKCGQPGCRRDEPEPRVVDTARGQVQWNENEYFCRKCRKSFFPSDGLLGLESGSNH
jgi:uncharacterized protein with PIN domain